METEYSRAVVADHKALHFLLVHRKVARLDVQVAVPREAQHVLTLGVPGNTVSIRLLQRKYDRIRESQGVEATEKQRRARKTYFKIKVSLRCLQKLNMHPCLFVFFRQADFA